MRIVIAGAHGRVARRLGRLLTTRGDTGVGIIRDPGHEADLAADGGTCAVLDLESAPVDEVAGLVSGADAVVFAAGAELSRATPGPTARTTSPLRRVQLRRARVNRDRAASSSSTG